jgi:hypothetical protein
VIAPSLGPSDCRVADFADIQSAINALPPSGGKIFVNAGTYSISSTVQIVFFQIGGSNIGRLDGHHSKAISTRLGVELSQMLCREARKLLKKLGLSHMSACRAHPTRRVVERLSKRKKLRKPGTRMLSSLTEFTPGLLSLAATFGSCVIQSSLASERKVCYLDVSFPGRVWGRHMSPTRTIVSGIGGIEGVAASTPLRGVKASGQFDRRVDRRLGPLSVRFKCAVRGNAPADGWWTLPQTPRREFVWPGGLFRSSKRFSRTD